MSVEHRWNEAERGKLMCSDKTCPVDTLSTTVPRTSLALNPGLRREIQLLETFPTRCGTRISITVFTRAFCWTPHEVTNFRYVHAYYKCGIYSCRVAWKTPCHVTVTSVQCSDDGYLQVWYLRTLQATEGDLAQASRYGRAVCHVTCSKPRTATPFQCETSVRIKILFGSWHV
jgi:hypothetical protein